MPSSVHRNWNDEGGYIYFRAPQQARIQSTRALRDGHLAQVGSCRQTELLEASREARLGRHERCKGLATSAGVAPDYVLSMAVLFLAIRATVVHLICEALC